MPERSTLYIPSRAAWLGTILLSSRQMKLNRHAVMSLCATPIIQDANKGSLRFSDPIPKVSHAILSADLAIFVWVFFVLQLMGGHLVIGIWLVSFIFFSPIQTSRNFPAISFLFLWMFYSICRCILYTSDRHHLTLISLRSF